MQIFICSTLEKHIRKFHNSLLRDLSTKFNFPLNGNFPHITLKSPFESAGTNYLEKYLANFSKSQKSVSFDIDGFGNFNKKFIYLEVYPSKEMYDFYFNLQEGLKKFPNIMFDSYDLEFKKFHITLLEKKELIDKFDDINDYLSNYKPSFSCSLDNILLLEQKPKKWERKKYYLKN